MAAVIAERAASHSRFIGGFNGLLDVPPLRYGGDASRVELLAPMPVYYVMLGAAGLGDGLFLWVGGPPPGPNPPAGRGQKPRPPHFRVEGIVLQNLCLPPGRALAGGGGRGLSG